MPQEIVELQVSGMDCNNCAASIQRFLERKGLEQVFVNFQTSEVRFARNDAALEIDAAKAGIEKLGYKVVTPSATKEDAKQWAIYRLLFCAAFTAPLLLSHLAMVLGFHTEFMDNRWVQLALAAPVYAVGGWYFGRSAWSGLRTGYLNMDVLIFLGATAAFVYSMVGFFWQDPHYYFFETAATIITLVLLGNWLEERAVQSTTTALGALAALQTDIATRIGASGSAVQIPVDELAKGDTIRVNTGDRVPLDARILHGYLSVDESMLTGESLPIERSPGDELIGGSLVVQGQADMEVLATRRQGTLAKMIELVKTAQADKPAMQRLADRISAVFVPLVIGISLLTFLIGWGSGYFTVTQALMNAIAVLLISCPCAMGLATPTAVMVGVGRLARQGVLVKGGQAVEDLASIQHMVFDKTGTLTTGQFAVKQIHYHTDHYFKLPADWQQQLPQDVSEKEELRSRLNSSHLSLYYPPSFLNQANKQEEMAGSNAGARVSLSASAKATTPAQPMASPAAAAKSPLATTQAQNSSPKEALPISQAAINALIYKLEGYSSHPIAQSIRLHFEQTSLGDQPEYIARLQVREEPGIGLLAYDEAAPGRLFLLGAARLLPEGHAAATDAQVFLTDGSGHLLASIELADDKKAGAAALMKSLQAMGITTHLLSGDRNKRVAELAAELGIASYQAEQLPAQKLAVLSRLSQKAPTAMVGDGVNDAAALARATIGISLGGASAAAMEAARIVLLRDRLPALSEAVRIARLTVKTIRESLFWAFSYNIVAIPLAAFGFLNPMWAALFMAFSDVVVIGNAVRLRFRK